MGKQLPGQDEGVPLPDSIPTRAPPKRFALGRWAGVAVMFVYYERFKRRRALSSRRGHR